MMRVIILGVLLAMTGIALAPEAAAACEPGTDRDFCTGWISSRLHGCVFQTEGCQWED